MVFGPPNYFIIRGSVDLGKNFTGIYNNGKIDFCAKSYGFLKMGRAFISSWAFWICLVYPEIGPQSILHHFLPLEKNSTSSSLLDTKVHHLDEMEINRRH